MSTCVYVYIYKRNTYTGGQPPQKACNIEQGRWEIQRIAALAVPAESGSHGSSTVRRGLLLTSFWTLHVWRRRAEQFAAKFRGSRISFVYFVRPAAIFGCAAGTFTQAQCLVSSEAAHLKQSEIGSVMNNYANMWNCSCKKRTSKYTGQMLQHLQKHLSCWVLNVMALTEHVS